MVNLINRCNPSRWMRVPMFLIICGGFVHMVPVLMDRWCFVFVVPVWGVWGCGCACVSTWVSHGSNIPSIFEIIICFYPLTHQEKKNTHENRNIK